MHTLTRVVNVIIGRLNCETQVVPISEYGDANSTFGYQYSNDGNSLFFTTALDVTAKGDKVGAWIQEVNKNCVGSSSSAMASNRAFTPLRHLQHQRH